MFDCGWDVWAERGRRFKYTGISPIQSDPGAFTCKHRATAGIEPPTLEA